MTGSAGLGLYARKIKTVVGKPTLLTGYDLTVGYMESKIISLECNIVI